MSASINIYICICMFTYFKLIYKYTHVHMVPDQSEEVRCFKHAGHPKASAAGEHRRPEIAATRTAEQALHKCLATGFRDPSKGIIGYSIV